MCLLLKWPAGQWGSRQEGVKMCAGLALKMQHVCSILLVFIIWWHSIIWWDSIIILISIIWWDSNIWWISILLYCKLCLKQNIMLKLNEVEINSFYPNVLIFLHKYICHICEVSHFCFPRLMDHGPTDPSPPPPPPKKKYTLSLAFSKNYDTLHHTNHKFSDHHIHKDPQTDQIHQIH